MEKTSRFCKWCSEPIPETMRSNAVYCSREHSNRAGAKRQRSRLTSEDWRRYNAARKTKREPKPRKKVWEPGQEDRECSRCDQRKPVGEFYWITTRNAPSSYCRPCTRSYAAVKKRAARGLPPDAVLRIREPKPAGHSYLHHGYRLVKQPGHHRADKYGYVYEHIVIAEKKYGIQITRDFTVHHKNANRSDNRLDNLELRIGVHGKGGDYIDTILASESARVAAAAILVGYGWTIAPPSPTATSEAPRNEPSRHASAV